MRRGTIAGGREARLGVGLLASWLALALIVVGTALAATSTAHAGPPAREEIAEACAYAAAIPPADIKDYTIRSGVFDIDGDGSFETVLGTESSGTAHGGDQEILDRNGQAVMLMPEDFDYSGDLVLGQRWLLHRGRAYLLGFAEEEAGYLRYLAFALPGGALHLGCTFDTRVTEQFRALDNADGQICRTVAQGEGESLPLHELPEEEQRQVRAKAEFAGNKTTLSGYVRADFANDGQPRELAYLTFESGAGRGCSAAYFDFPEALEGAAVDRRQRLLMRLQDVDPEDVFPTRNCGGAQSRWIRVDGRTYLETRYPGAAPTSEREELHRLALIRDGESRTVCEGRFTRTWIVRQEPQ